MNPIQGPLNTGGSSTQVNQADGESICSMDTSFNHMLNPVHNDFPHNSTPSGQPTYASSTSQNHNRWRFGECSSPSGSSNHVGSIGMKTNYHLPQYGGHHFAAYRPEGRQLGLNDTMAHGRVNAGSHIRNGPSLLCGSSSNAMPQHVTMSIDMATDGCGEHSSDVVLGHSYCQSSLGNPNQAVEESSSGPASSLGGLSLSCKRKTLEGAPTHSFLGESPDCVAPTENGAQYGASRSLTLAIPSQSSPNVTNHFGRIEQISGAGGGRAIATNGFHSTRNTDVLSRHGRRLNPRQPQESLGFSISHAGSSVRPTGSLQQNLPSNSPFVVRSVSITSGFSTVENQTNLVHLPSLTRNIHQFVLDASFNLRASNAPGIGTPVERFVPQWETPRSNPEQPMFGHATDTRNPVHDQSIWSFTPENPGSSMESPFVSQARSTSVIHPLQPNPTWILPQNAQLHNASRTAELSPWSLFPSIESQSRSHGASLPSLPTGPSVSSNEVTTPSSSNSRSYRSRQRRSGLLSERQNDPVHLRHLGRSLAADSDGRNQPFTEMRQVLTATERGENLRFEDYMVFDPLIYQRMTEMHDRHREMRLDVDNMSYEELVALGERIGDVNTGLREDVILKAMKQHKYTSSSAVLHQDIEPCCICQEEHAEGDDLGTLDCGHIFHKDCIKQWVMLKNLCPICKSEALTTL